MARLYIVDRHHLNIKFHEVRKTDLNYLKHLISRKDLKRHLAARAGVEHYRLLAYLSANLTGKIVELGTHHGTGSLALCHNPEVQVETWDLIDKYSAKQTPNNLNRRIGDVLQLNPDTLLNASMIFLDTNHDGVFESQVLEYLRSKEFQGLILLDDIFFNDAMEMLWTTIKEEKFDLTEIGHGRRWQRGTPRGISGTGLVSFVPGKVLLSP